MAIWPFNRNKTENSDLPPEVQDYYQAEKREKVGIAGLLALATLVVTILLAIGLFFGGRWVYRTVFDNGSNDNTTQQASDSEDNQAETEDEASTSSSDEPEQQPTTETPDAPAPEVISPSTPSTSGNSSATNTQSDNLPNTGPADTLAIFIGTVIVGASLYYVLGNRKTV